MNKKLISWNVNGIRASAKKGLFEWLAKEDADVVCVQELKAQPDQIQGAPFYPEGVHTYLHSAEKKGYSGVALYCKREPDKVHYGLGEGFEDADFKDGGSDAFIDALIPWGSSATIHAAYRQHIAQGVGHIIMTPLGFDLDQDSGWQTISVLTQSLKDSGAA